VKKRNDAFRAQVRGVCQSNASYLFVHTDIFFIVDTWDRPSRTQTQRRALGRRRRHGDV